MKIVKNINNVCLCLDSQAREVVVFGKGIGFKKPPSELPLDVVDRTFYNVNSNYLSMINQIPDDVLQVSLEIVDYANKKMGHTYEGNVVFTLADHIQFAIKRIKQNLAIKLPILYDISISYPKEMKIAKHGLELINRRFHVSLPKEEAAYITMHLIGYGTKSITNAQSDEMDLIKKSVSVIEEFLGIHVDKSGFNYTRFVTHMFYLFERVQDDKGIESNNLGILASVKKECQKEYQCAWKVNESVFSGKLTEEELIYLVLHINRLYIREE